MAAFPSRMNAKITNMQVAEAARRVAARDFLGAKAYIESVYQAAHTAGPAKWAQQAVLDVGPLRVACEKAGVAIVRPRRNPKGPPPVAYRGHVIEPVGRDFIVQPYGWRHLSLRGAKAAIDRVEDNIDVWMGRAPRKNPTSRDIAKRYPAGTILRLFVRGSTAIGTWRTDGSLLRAVDVPNTPVGYTFSEWLNMVWTRRGNSVPADMSSFITRAEPVM